MLVDRVDLRLTVTASRTPMFVPVKVIVSPRPASAGLRRLVVLGLDVASIVVGVVVLRAVVLLDALE